MKKFTASELIKRATQLADIENTDFLNHEEMTNYINEAWRTVYQWLINKGDKQFVNEVQLSGNGYNGYLEYQLPDDLYQILSIRTPTGETIGRKAESESDNSNKYEVVNDRLRLYGTTSDLILTYYTVPIWITYPDKTIPLELSNDILSSYSNSILLSDGSIINTLTGETIASIDLESLRETFGDAEGQYWLDETNPRKLLNGVILYTDKYSNYALVNFNSEIVEYQKHNSYNKAIEGFDYKGNVIYLLDNKLYDYKGKEIGTRGNFLFENGALLEITKGKLTFYNKDDEETEIEFDGQESDTNYIIKNGTFISGNKLAYKNKYIIDAEEMTITEIDTEYPKVLASLKYGPITSNYSYIQLESNIEDTEFNFPNELYVQLLAADLGLRFLFKMNADSSGLNNQYEAMRTAFMNSLTQDGNYSRITNYYRG